MELPTTHAGSRHALLGASPSPDLVQLMSVEKHVTSSTPPTLLMHSQDDGAVPVSVLRRTGPGAPRNGCAIVN